MLWNKKILMLGAFILFVGFVCALGFYQIAGESQNTLGNAMRFKANESDSSSSSTAVKKLFQGKNAQTEKAPGSMAAIQNAIKTNILEMEKNQPWNLAELDETQIMSLLAMEKKTLASHERAEQVLEDADKEDMLQEIRVLKHISMQRIALLSTNLNIRN